MLRHVLITTGLATLASGQVLYRTEFHNSDEWTFDPPRDQLLVEGRRAAHAWHR